MDDRFLTAFFPGEARVCGRKLKNFSAYHYLILTAIRSPFLGHGERIAPEDLLIASKACSKRFESSFIVPKLSASFQDLIWKARLRHNPELFQTECERFADLISAHSSHPKFWEVITGGQETRPLTGPRILIVVCNVIRRCNISLDQAWNMSFGQLQWINAEMDELEGSERRFLDETELKGEVSL